MQERLACDIPDGREHSHAAPPTRQVRRSRVQTKLSVGAADDPYEREADAVAAQVVAALRAGPAPAADVPHTTPSPVTRIRRMSSIGAGGGYVGAGASAAIESSRGGGRPLGTKLRANMERAFGGVDFAEVRLHRDAQSDVLNRSLGARAFTTGTDIFVHSDEGDLGGSAGQELLAHELTHVVQQAPGISRIQRKIGFEFEFPTWRTAEADAGDYAAATAWPPDQTNWKRIAKGKALARGTGYELQADDDPGIAAQSDLEVVTKAFDDSMAGRGELRTAMLEIVARLNAVNASFNGWAGGPAGHLPRATDLGMTVVRPRSFIYPAGGQAFNAKPQTTMGLTLGKIADMMEDIFAAPAETAAETLARRPGRKAMTGWDDLVAAAGAIMRIQGGAPAEARQAIAAYAIVVPAAPASTPELVSVLSLIIAYLQMADQGLVRSYPKTIAPMMARTDFGALFKMLTPAEQTFYKHSSGQRLFDLAKSAPALVTMQLNDEVFSQQVANAHAGVSDAQGLTRGKWIKGIAKGTDFLSGKKFPVKSKREDMQGLGSYGSKTDTVGDGVGHKGAILELRAMPTTPLADLPAVADRIFLYAYLVNRGGAEKYGEVIAPF